ncbi:MAG: hypothetical protein HQ546_09650, partial [Planctomycetes bacterium]|nr:hypothetical protein [Planctomycetota bacterium]
MSHQRRHIVEKIQVEVAAVAALAAMYFWGWGIIKPTDVDGVAVFLHGGGPGRLIGLAVVVWLLAGVSALLTMSARPEGALLATMVGVGGASLHSEPMRFLLMRHDENISG